MISFVICLVLAFTGIIVPSVQEDVRSDSEFAIVYHFDNNMCLRQGRVGLPLYLIHSIEQTLRVHGGDVNIVVLTNAADCKVTKVLPSTFSNTESEVLSKVMLVDFKTLKEESEIVMKAESSLQFTLFNHIFNKSHPGNSKPSSDGHLYLTSMARFVYLEGLMRVSVKGSLRCVDGRTVPPISELLLVESDNLLFADIKAMLPRIRESYHHMAGVIQSHVNLVASVLYVSNVIDIAKFNKFILGLAHNASKFEEFTTYYLAHQNPRRVPGGLPPYDDRGYGIPRFAINEMSILLYYHRVCFETSEENMPPVRCLESFPLFGRQQGLTQNSRHADFLAYIGHNSRIANELPPELASYRRVVGNATYDAGWDPGSWGQFLAGTYLLKRPPGFIDLIHLPGKAIVKSACQVKMLCSCTRGRDPPPKDYSGTANRVVGDLLPSIKRFLYDSFTRRPANDTDKTLWMIRRDGVYSQSIKIRAEIDYLSPLSGSSNNQEVHYSAPYVRCCANVGGKAPVQGTDMNSESDENNMKEVGYGSDNACGPWQPLVNLHMHSKNALPFLSKACVCE